MSEFIIGGRHVGGGAPCFIIAEIGINHNGDINIAKQMIDIAADAGCDAAKFQAYKAENLYSTKAGKLDWEDKKGKYSYDIFTANKSFEMPFEWLPELKAYCEKKKILFFSSVWDEPSTDVLDKLGMPFFKIGSSAVTNIPLLKHVASKKKPVFMAVAGATLGEVEEAIATVKQFTNDLVIMHCHLKYPTPPMDANLNVMKTIQYAFPDVVPGYSDHTESPSDAPVTAVLLGAKVIEKHITLDKKMKGPDHFFALESKELKQMVQDIRKAEQQLAAGKQVKPVQEMLGSSVMMTHEDERYLRDFAYTTIITLQDIKKGARLTRENVRVLRPGKLARGLEPKFYDVIVGNGYKAARDIPMGKAIMWDDLMSK